MSSLSPRKNVIITGASGLLGGWLVRQAPRGISVIGQTLSRPLPREWHAHEYREQSFDLTAPNTLEYIFRDMEPSAVIHTAARSIPAQCDNDLPGARLEN